MVTVDIKADGKNYILEWYKPGEHSDEPYGYIAITEACDADSHGECELETYDLRGIG